MNNSEQQPEKLEEKEVQSTPKPEAQPTTESKQQTTESEQQTTEPKQQNGKKPSKFSGFFEKLNNITLRVSLQEKIIFTRHLSIMIKAGMPILDSLKMLTKQTKSRALVKILHQVVADVSNGQFLATSLGKYKNVFGALFVNIIKIGETGGILSDNLEYLSQELKKKSEMRKKVIGALVYPIIILVATFGITGLLTVFIFPKILPVFSSLNVELPATTKVLIAVSSVLTQQGPLMVAISFGLIIALIAILRITTVRFYAHRLILYVPLVGKMIQNVNMANFSRTLGLLLKSGVKIVEALNITADTLANLIYRKELKDVAKNIQKGEFISKHLLMRKHLFPAMLSNMIAVGENTGNLSDTLLYLSGVYESEVEEITKNLSNVLEPILMVTMGIIVGFVALSIIMPIYQVTQSF